MRYKEDLNLDQPMIQLYTTFQGRCIVRLRTEAQPGVLKVLRVSLIKTAAEM